MLLPFRTRAGMLTAASRPAGSYMPGPHTAASNGSEGASPANMAQIGLACISLDHLGGKAHGFAEEQGCSLVPAVRGDQGLQPLA